MVLIVLHPNDNKNVRWAQVLQRDLDLKYFDFVELGKNRSSYGKRCWEATISIRHTSRFLQERITEIVTNEM